MLLVDVVSGTIETDVEIGADCSDTEVVLVELMAPVEEIAVVSIVLVGVEAVEAVEAVEL